MRLIRGILTFTIFLVFISCESVTNVKPVGKKENSSTSSNYTLKILNAGAGNTSKHISASAVVGDEINLKAAVFSPAGNYIEDVEVFWSVDGGNFTVNDLINFTNILQTDVTFKPSRTGAVLIKATYIGSVYNLTSITASSGLLSVNSGGAIDSISVISGNNQSGIVDQNLATVFEVEALDSFSNPVQGASIVFSSELGGGSIVGSTTVATDASGRASVTVRLGTTSGTNNNLFQATSLDDSSKYVSIQASANAGAVAGIEFGIEPAAAFVNSNFGVQPVIYAVDAFSNRTTLSSGTVSITLNTGGGSLSGTTTASFTNGAASFTDLQYDTQEAIDLAASYSTFAATSASFSVGAPVPGACQNTDSYFRTEDGGCKDLVSGLVWSNLKSSISWQNSIWDSEYGAASDVDDLGWTNDYSAVNISQCIDSPCTTEMASYCHSLNEGNRTDWRVPTVYELQELYTNYTVAGAGPYLANFGSFSVWSSRYAGGFAAYRVSLVDGNLSTSNAANAYELYCVRGGRKAPSQIEVTSDQYGVQNNTPYGGSPIIVQVKDEDGKNVFRSGETITIIDSDIGSLGGTLTFTTNSAGYAELTGFSVDIPGPSATKVILTISSTYGVVTTSLNVGFFPQTCRKEDSNFQTLDGGCKDLALGKVWSKMSTYSMNWYDAIFDSTAPAGNVPADGDDAGLLDDYANSPGANPDNSYNNYCADLNEGGYTDWRVPTHQELFDVYKFGVGSNLYFDVPDFYVWSSTTNGGNSLSAAGRTLISGLENTIFNKTSGIHAICVRVP